MSTIDLVYNFLLSRTAARPAERKRKITYGSRFSLPKNTLAQLYALRGLRHLFVAAGKAGGDVLTVLAPHIASTRLFPNSHYNCQDLSNGHYANQDGSACSFIGADLSNASFHRSHLTNANLTDANLANAELSFTDLTKANLTNASLSNTYFFQPDFTNANLTGANLNGAWLSGSNLTEVQLRDASDLRNVMLANSNLTGYNLSSLNLTGARLDDAALIHANLSDANLTDAYLVNTTLKNADLTRTNLRNANLSRANLTGTDLSTADLTHADLTGANLNTTILASCMPSLPVTNGANVTVAKDTTVNTMSGTTVDGRGILTVQGTLVTPSVEIVGLTLLESCGNILGDISVSRDGVLIGTGTVTGNLANNRGRIAVHGLTPGTLTVTGDYTQNAGDFIVAISNPATFDVLHIGGSASFFGGNLCVNLVAGYTPQVGASFNILLSENGIYGADSVVAPPCWSFVTNGTVGTLQFIGE